MPKCGNCNFCSRGRRRLSSTSSEVGAISLGLINLLSLWMASSRMTFVLVFAAGIIASTVIQLLPEILHIAPTTEPGFNRKTVLSEEQQTKWSALPWQEHVQPVDESTIYESNIILHRNVRDEAVDKRSQEAEALAALKVALEMKANGKQDKALKLFQHAYALNSTHPDILNHYGEFLEEHTKDILLAEHMYTRALVLCPVHSKALENRQRTLPLVVELDDDRLRRVDLKRGKLMRIPESSAALRRVKKEAYFQHIHHTVAIEGNTMTLAETRSIVETKLAVGGKSILEHNEILGLEAALSYINNTLVNKMGYLTVQDILDIHRRVLGSADPMEAGTFRVTQVFIGDHVPPSPSEVYDLMREFILWLNSVEALALHPIKHAALAHYKLVFIHPFTNGNGRTARLLMNLILMRAGYPPVIIRMQDRQRYYDCLKVANEGDVRPFVRFIAECTERTLDVYLFATTEYSGRDVPALETRDRRTIIV